MYKLVIACVTVALTSLGCGDTTNNYLPEEPVPESKPAPPPPPPPPTPAPKPPKKDDDDDYKS